MLRVLIGATRILSTNVASNSRCIFQNVANPSLIPVNSRNICSALTATPASSSLLVDPCVKKITNNTITRNVIKFSMLKGKRKSVKAVLKRFYRLHWGAWIRTKCGREKRLWKKTPQRKRRLRQHVFCNSTQNTLLDKMVTNFWRKPKYYVNDPYEPYHTREEWKLSSKKPRPYFPPDQS